MGGHKTEQQHQEELVAWGSSRSWWNDKTFGPGWIGPKRAGNYFLRKTKKFFSASLLLETSVLIRRGNKWQKQTNKEYKALVCDKKTASGYSVGTRKGCSGYIENRRESSAFRVCGCYELWCPLKDGAIAN